MPQTQIPNFGYSADGEDLRVLNNGTANLTPEQLSALQNWTGGNTGSWTPYYSNGLYYEPTYSVTGGSGAEGEGGTTQRGYLSYAMPGGYNPEGNGRLGNMYHQYDADGQYLNTSGFQESSPAGSFGLALASALSMGLGLGGVTSAGEAIGPASGFGWSPVTGSGVGTGVGATGSGGLSDLFTTGFTDAGTAGGALDTAYATGAASTPWTTLGSGVLPSGVGAVGSGLSATPSQAMSGVKTLGGLLGGAGGSGSNGGGSGLNAGNLAQLLSGAWDYNQQNKASGDMLNWLKERQAINDNMYKPGSPEYNALWDEMSRKDAAGGRNSQYGPRSVDLAARIAQLKMDANTRMTTGIGNFMANSLNQRASAGAGLSAGLGSLFNGGSGGLDASTLDMISNALTTNFRQSVIDNPASGGDGWWDMGDSSLWNY